MCELYKKSKTTSSILNDFRHVWNFWTVFKTTNLFENSFKINIDDKRQFYRFLV